MGGDIPIDTLDAAIACGSGNGLSNVKVVSAVESDARRFEIIVNGTLTFDPMSRTKADADAIEKLCAGGFDLRVIVVDGVIISHEWVGVQFS